MTGIEIAALIPFLRPTARRGGGFIGRIIHWFIMIAIYQICIGAIADFFNVTHMVACFIFIGILLAISAVGYVLKQKVSPGIDD